MSANQKSCSDAELIELIGLHGMRGAAERLGIGERRVYERRRAIEKRLGRAVNSPNSRAISPTHPARLEMEIHHGIIMIGSDHHYWPGPASTAHRAFVKLCKDLSPALVVANGDVLDGATISRHPPIGWEKNPPLKEELEVCSERLGEIAMAAKKAERVWCLGNHDARFETRLATVASEYAEICGLHLKDHMPDWSGCWSLWVNDDLVIKHRFKGGIHAPHNNTLWAGKTVVTGHLHSQRVSPFTDYHGTRWGVDCGTMADVHKPNPAFVDYTEDNPLNWRSGFAVLTYEDGMLLTPELVRVIDDGLCEFRGKTFKV